MTYRQGDIWLMDFGEPIGSEQAGRRPAVVVSDDEMNRGPSGLVIVVPITSTFRGLVSHIELDDEGTGLDVVSYAKCEDLKSISDRRLVTHLGSAPIEAMFHIRQVLTLLLTL